MELKEKESCSYPGNLLIPTNSVEYTDTPHGKKAPHEAWASIVRRVLVDWIALVLADATFATSRSTFSKSA